MVSHLVFYQLMLIALLWLFLMLSWVWPSEPAAARPIPPTPVTPPRKRSTAPTPFPGLIRQPHCDACEQAVASHREPPCAPSPRLISTRGRRRQVDTSRHFCPDPDCTYGGWLGLGNITSNGHPSGGPWRQLHCTGCGGSFQETHGTPLHGKRVAPDLLVWAVGARAEGVGIRAVARVFAVDPNTVLAWLVEVAEHAAAFSRSFLYDVRVTQVQLDELFALLSAVKDGEVSEAEAVQRLSRAPPWVWAAMDPESQLLLALNMGDRALAMAQRVVHQVVQVLAPGWLPRPELRYAQGIKTGRRRRLVHVSHCGVFGTLEAVQQVLAACGWQINTAFIERLNLSMRQHVAALGRRVTTLCKHEDGVRQQLVLYHVYYNFCVPHASLRLPLVGSGCGSAKQWRPCTPAMAAGL